MSLESELPQLARAIIRSQKSPESVVRARLPRFLAQLKRVGAEHAALNRWGACVNVDEYSGTEIVAPKILQLLGRQTGVNMKPPILHAGVQHTYGYLLSLTPTPFGFKRTRWLQPTIEQGFQLPPGSLQALPSRGTLLTNLTSFLSRIALRDQRPVKILGTNPIDSWHTPPVSGWRITESIRRAKLGELLIHIDLIPFLHQIQSGHSALLVYCIAANGKPARITTTFPIADEMLQQMLALPGGRSVEIRLRFNAHVDGFGTAPLAGKRSVQAWSLS